MTMLLKKIEQILREIDYFEDPINQERATWGSYYLSFGVNPHALTPSQREAIKNTQDYRSCELQVKVYTIHRVAERKALLRLIQEQVDN